MVPVDYLDTFLGATAEVNLKIIKVEMLQHSLNKTLTTWDMITLVDTASGKQIYGSMIQGEGAGNTNMHLLIPQWSKKSYEYPIKMLLYRTGGDPGKWNKNRKCKTGKW